MKRISTAHLVFGIVFTGIAMLWLIGQSTDATWHDTAPGFPAVLIGAGIVGLIASLANARRRRQAEFTPYDEQPGAPAPAADQQTEDTPEDTPEDTTEDTTVLPDPNQEQS